MRRNVNRNVSNAGKCKRHSVNALSHHGLTTVMVPVTGRLGSVTTSAGNFWTRRQTSLDSAEVWSPRQHKIGRLGKGTASASTFWDASAYNIGRLASI